MATDLEKSLIDYLWIKYTDSTTLKAAMGGTVRCYLAWAIPDATFPYLVHRLAIRKHPGTHVVQKAAYYLDIWSDSPDANEILAIRVLIVGLLDELVFSTADVKQCHIEFMSSGFVPESEQDIFHYATMWDIAFRRDTEAGIINSR